jgi:hypothetical protein
MVQAAPHHLLRLLQADGVMVQATHHLHLRLLPADGAMALAAPPAPTVPAVPAHLPVVLPHGVPGAPVVRVVQAVRVVQVRAALYHGVLVVRAALAVPVNLLHHHPWHPRPCPHLRLHLDHPRLQHPHGVVRARPPNQALVNPLQYPHLYPPRVLLR